MQKASRVNTHRINITIDIYKYVCMYIPLNFSMKHANFGC